MLRHTVAQREYSQKRPRQYFHCADQNPTRPCRYQAQPPTRSIFFIRLGQESQKVDLLADLRRLIYSHPRLTERAARVRFVEILRDSYRLQINCYVDSSEYSQFLAVSEDLNLRILSLLEEHGLQLAVPVQQWVRGDNNADAGDANIPDTTLQAFPDFEKEAKNNMKGTLEYPEKGRHEQD